MYITGKKISGEVMSDNIEDEEAVQQSKITYKRCIVLQIQKEGGNGVKINCETAS